VLDYFGVGSPGASLRTVIEGGHEEADAVAVSEALVPQACIRDARWRLVFRGRYGDEDDVAAAIRAAPLDARHFALYDVAADPGQGVDALARAPGEAERLRARLLAR
jgi:hypothetical protein